MDKRDVLKRLLYQRCKSAIEFQFDTLIANPLLTYITVQDIAQLHKIATSIKYSSKPKEKYAMIDKILVPRGFKKMASGTNRVVYRFLNDYRIVLKVAIDKVGLSDNGNEYRVQHLLKPFVTKCFEVSPCGTVGLFERVVPITSREEFENIAEDVFDLINNLIGKFVLEDIGEKFYMNYGLREGFGPVLLDYPYVFELDGRKLYCNVPEPFEPSGYCGGEIDYDIGYNNLICTKCGKRYLATELKTDEKSDKPKIIIKGEDMIMKCVLRRGDEIVAKLNSEEHVATNTIKSSRDFSRLKATIRRPESEEQKKETYRPTAKTRDEVILQARLKGNKRGKDIDAEARKEQEIIDRNTPKIPVSFNNEFFNFDNIYQMKEESKLEASISKPEVIDEPKEVEPPKVETTRTEIPLSPEPVIEDEPKVEKETLPAEVLDDDSTVVDNPDIIKVRIENCVIYNVETNKIIGYTIDNPIFNQRDEDESPVETSSYDIIKEVCDKHAVMEKEETVEEDVAETLGEAVKEAVDTIAEAIGNAFEEATDTITEAVKRTSDDNSEEEIVEEDVAETLEESETIINEEHEPFNTPFAENPVLREFAESLEQKVEKEAKVQEVKVNKNRNNKNNKFNHNNNQNNGRRGVTVRSATSPVNSNYSAHNKEKRRQMEQARNNY